VARKGVIRGKTGEAPPQIMDWIYATQTAVYATIIIMSVCLCLSVRLSASPSIRPSASPSVRPSVCLFLWDMSGQLTL